MFYRGCNCCHLKWFVYSGVVKYQRQLWLAVWHLCYWEISVSASALSVSHLKWIWPFFSLGSHLELMCQILWCKLKENILTKFRQKKIFGKFCSLAALLSPACNGVACDVLEGIFTLSTVQPHIRAPYWGYISTKTVLLASSLWCFPPLAVSVLLWLLLESELAVISAECSQQSLCWASGRPG